MMAGCCLPASSRKQAFKRLAVFGAEFENVADFDGAPDAQGLAAIRTSLARLRQAQIAPLLDTNVAFDINVAQMKSVLVRARGHVGGAAQRLVRINRQILHAHRAQAAGMRLQRRENLLRLGGAKRCRAERRRSVSLRSIDGRRACRISTGLSSTI